MTNCDEVRYQVRIDVLGMSKTAEQRKKAVAPLFERALTNRLKDWGGVILESVRVVAGLSPPATPLQLHPLSLTLKSLSAQLSRTSGCARA